MLKPTKHVAVLVETSRQYGRGLLNGVSRFFHENGRWSIYFRPHDLGEALPAWLEAWNGDGILARITSQKMAERLIATGIPLIDLRGGGRALGLPPFGPRSESICELAFNHLRELGLRHFAFCGEPTGRHVYDDERRDLFRKLAEESGCECHEFPATSPRNWEEQQKRLAAWLKSLPKPVGVMACHDDRGQHILDACRRCELEVPDEVAVIGVDNDSFLCNFSIPSLSSIDVNSERIGYEAASLLDQLMRKQAEFKQPVFFEPAGVVARQSTDIRACGDPDIATAIRFISQHACHGITVADVERRTAISRSLLNRRFKKIVGRTPKAEILRVQMESAKQLLIDTDLPIGVVSERTGFSEAKYFIEVFRNRTGLTPRAYRNKFGRQDVLAE